MLLEKKTYPVSKTNCKLQGSKVYLRAHCHEAMTLRKSLCQNRPVLKDKRNKSYVNKYNRFFSFPLVKTISDISNAFILNKMCRVKKSLITLETKR